MGETIKKSNIVLRVFIGALLAAVAALSASYFTGCRNSSASPGSDAVQVVLEDGTPLAERLDELETAINSSQGGTAVSSVRGCPDLKEDLSTSNENLVKEIKKLFKNNSLMNVRPTYPPIRHFDLSEMPGKGSKDAVVTLIEFSDFQCPYCARMALQLDSLVEENPDKVRLIFVDRILLGKRNDGFPFHPYALPAHEAAAEAKAQGGFWKMYSYIFKHQREVFPKGRPKDQEDYQKKKKQLREDLIKAAGELGLDKNAMRNALENHTHRDALLRTNNIVKGMDINSTPTVWTSGFFRPQNLGAVLDMISNAKKLK